MTQPVKMTFNNSTEFLEKSKNNTMCLSNDSSECFEHPEFNASVENVLLAITLTLVDVVTIFGNLLVLLAFVMEKRLLQPFNMFILNLAVTDFLVAITAMTFYTIDTLLGYWPFGYVMCGVWIYFDFAMTFASVFTLVAISVDRFWCVTWAIHYKMHNNKNKTAVIIAIIWFFVFAIWTPPFIGDRLKHSDEHSCIWEPDDNREFVIFVAVIGHYMPCLIMVLCYVKVFVVMRRQALVVGSAVSSANPTVQVNIRPASGKCGDCSNNSAPSKTGSQGSGKKHIHLPMYDEEVFHINHPSYLLSAGSTNSGQYSPPSRPGSMGDQMESRPGTRRQKRNKTNQVSQSQNRERRIFITLTYVVSSYIICWFPFYIAFDIFAWKPKLVPAGLYSFFFWMTYVNSTLNPFIYAYTSKDFRAAFVKVLRSIGRCSK